MNFKFNQVPLHLLNLSRKRLAQQCFLFRKSYLIFQSKRHYLPQSYYCQEKWQGRLSDPYVKSIKPTDFYYELIRKYKAEGKVSAIDVDIFIHSLNEKKALELSEETEEVIRLLRRSPETINTLPSTPHTLIRNLLETKQYDLLFKTLTDPLNYGVFLDYYVADILMDTFLKEENFTAASRIASMLMLQEDYGPPLTRAFVLLSCFKYAFNEKENPPWTDYHIVQEPEEEVKIIVKYIRNPFFDDHFDLREPLHLVGKTLAWLVPHLKETEEIIFKFNSEILGWSLYEKWDKLESVLLNLLKKKEQLDESILLKTEELVSGKCQDLEIKSRFEDILVKIKDQNLVSKLGLYEKVEEHCFSYVKKYEKEVAEAQQNIYDEWTVKRKDAVQHQLDMYEKARLMKEIQEKKDDLQRREDVIFFFDNREKWELLKPKRKFYPKVWSLKYGKKKPRQVDSEYIPPEI